MDRSKLPDDRDSDEIKLSSVDSKQISKEYTHSQEIYRGQINPPLQKNIANENMKKRATPLNTHKEISMATPKFTEEEYLSNKMLEKVEYNISDEKDNQLKFKEETKISKEINLPLKLEDSKKIIIKKKNQESKLIVEKNQTSKSAKSVHSLIYLWGSGKDGRLANILDNSESIPNLVKSNKNFISIICGYHHSAGITIEGELFTWGKGLFGQLGHANNQSISNPQLVSELSKVKVVQVACGWQHTIALTNDGQVFSWGYGEDGQLGHGNTDDLFKPKLISKLKSRRITQIACGHSHSGAIGNGDLFMWGSNPDSRLMIEKSDNILEPSLTLMSQLKNENSELFSAKYVSLGVSHSAVITRSGELFTAGSKQDGQLGADTDDKNEDDAMSVESKAFDNTCSALTQVLPFGDDEAPKAIAVSCGDSFTLVLDDTYKVSSFGKGTHGRLGHGNESNISHPQTIKSLKKLKITNISAGCRHAAAVSDKGELYCWGFNFYEQLGIGEGDKDVIIPTKVSSKYFQSVYPKGKINSTYIIKQTSIIQNMLCLIIFQKYLY